MIAPLEDVWGKRHPRRTRGLFRRGTVCKTCCQKRRRGKYLHNEGLLLRSPGGNHHLLVGVDPWVVACLLRLRDVEAGMRHRERGLAVDQVHLLPQIFKPLCQQERSRAAAAAGGKGGAGRTRRRRNLSLGRFLWRMPTMAGRSRGRPARRTMETGLHLGEVTLEWRALRGRRISCFRATRRYVHGYDRCTGYVCSARHCGGLELGRCSRIQAK